MAALLLAVSSFFALAPQSASALSGSGTEQSPFLVASCADLWSVGDLVDDDWDEYGNKHYRQTADISCVGWNNAGQPFIPIGSPDEPFLGTYDGRGYTISDFTMQRTIATETGHVGLFGNAYGQIKDVRMIDADVQATIDDGVLWIGILAGSHNGAISGSSVQGNVTATKQQGDGFVYAGGLVGSTGGSIDNSYSNASVSATSNSSVATVYPYHEVYAGGLAGNIRYADITNSYSRGTVSAVGGKVTRAGGFAGQLLDYQGAGNITNSFAVPTSVNSSSTVNDPSVHHGSFLGYRDEIAGINGSYVKAIEAEMTGTGPDFGVTEIQQTSYFQDATNAPMDEWDFEDIWVIDESNDGFAYLRPATSGDPSTPSASTDKNGDGIIDADQDNVASHTSSITGKTVVLEVDEICEVNTAQIKAELAYATQDAGYDYPQGLLDFTTDCGTPGFTTTVKQYYYGVSPSDYVARKHNPTLNAYFTIQGATIDTTTIYGQEVTVVTYEVKDGGSLDIDGTENGIIIDPAGLGRSVVGVPNTGLGGSARSLRSL